jgi:hypothetical protein
LRSYWLAENVSKLNKLFFCFEQEIYYSLPLTEDKTLEIFEKISQGANLDWHNPHDEQLTPIHSAMVCNQLCYAEMLIQNGCSIFEKESSNWTPMVRLLTSCPSFESILSLQIDSSSTMRHITITYIVHFYYTSMALLVQLYKSFPLTTKLLFLLLNPMDIKVRRPVFKNSLRLHSQAEYSQARAYII